MAKSSWMQTYTGVAFEPYNLTEGMFNILDIAHALSNTCRFSGHCKNFYSVAQHCVLVSRVLEEAGEDRETVLLGLLHDSSEAYISDLPSPVKSGLPEYKNLENEIELFIYKRYNLDVTEERHQIVKAADVRMLVTEARDVMDMPPKPWGFDVPPYTGFKIYPLLPREARNQYLLRYEQIMLKFVNQEDS